LGFGLKDVFYRPGIRRTPPKNAPEPQNRAHNSKKVFSGIAIMARAASPALFPGMPPCFPGGGMQAEKRSLETENRNIFDGMRYI
jgi:hypothetical protein